MSYVRNDSLMYQMPVHFGPCVTPRQNKEGKRFIYDQATRLTKHYNINRSTANWSSVGCTFCCIFPGCSRFYFSRTPKISAGKGLFFCIKFSILNI